MTDRRPRAIPVRLSPPILLAALLSLSISATSSASDGIAWRTDFDLARAEAKSRNLPLWIQFTGPWCVYCRKMEREVFTRTEVIAAATDYVPVKLRADHREDLFAFYGVTSMPTTILAKSGGEAVARVNGFADAGPFLSFLQTSRPVPAPPEIALKGFSPVGLVEGRGLTPGKAEFTVQRDGLIYRFADAREREDFQREPERYLLRAHGLCPVSLVSEAKRVPGKPDYGVYYQGRLYLCADETSRKEFAKDPKKFSAADLGDEGYCPHCRNVAGRLVPGRPQYSATHFGLRFLFPDALHLEAFRAAPETFLRR